MNNTMLDGTHEVAIFWDFPSCPPPADRPGSTVTNGLRRIAQAFGCVKLFKAYLAISEHSRSNGDRASEIRAELQVCGISLTDVPYGSPSSVADQMITVDMLVHASDRSPARTTLLLITNNPMFAYAISTLRLRGYNVVVVTSSQDYPTLVSQASAHFDWASDVLKHRIHLPTTPEFSKAPLAPLHSNLNEAGVQANGGNSKLGANLESYSTGDSSRNNPPIQHPQPQTPKAQVNGKGRASQSEVELENFLPNLKSRPPRGSDTETPYELLSPRFRGQTPGLYGDPPFNIASTFSGDLTPQRPAQATSNPLAESGPSWPNFGKTPSVRGGPSIPATPRNVSISRRSTSNGHADDYIPTAPSFNNSGIQPTQTFGQVQTGLSAAATAFQPSSTETNQGLASNSHFRPMSSPRIPSSSALPTPPSRASMSNISLAANVNIAVAFQPLVDILRAHRTRGSHSPLRSTVALELIQQDKDVYKKAGLEKFAQYSALAEKEGIVKLGGKNGGAWIQLHPNWY